MRGTQRNVHINKNTTSLLCVMVQAASIIYFMITSHVHQINDHIRIIIYLCIFTLICSIKYVVYIHNAEVLSSSLIYRYLKGVSYSCPSLKGYSENKTY